MTMRWLASKRSMTRLQPSKTILLRIIGMSERVTSTLITTTRRTSMIGMMNTRSHLRPCTSMLILQVGIRNRPAQHTKGMLFDHLRVLVSSFLTKQMKLVKVHRVISCKASLYFDVKFSKM